MTRSEKLDKIEWMGTSRVEGEGLENRSSCCYGDPDWDAEFDADVLPVVVGKRRLKGHHVITKEFHGDGPSSKDVDEAVIDSKYEAQAQQKAPQVQNDLIIYNCQIKSLLTLALSELKRVATLTFSSSPAFDRPAPPSLSTSSRILHQVL
ncbi:hypothetical protein K435DRAFT_803316 [Dendrothele bispora CBS 962.96]|uniref:Uncharacterized protein n=1 Tax=Dendrothele bispora (strain CBS 962.96) TaxID=1314807 RepID=A0A4V6T578_DENBC|nr:hypothetical protein K435DRAFT_803316 [Dendrothele bispora CBS 962.96]